MARQECIREVFTAPPDAAYLAQRREQGWRIRAVEWVRETEGETARAVRQEAIPYGLRVGPDCLHLEEEPTEKQAMILMLELIIQDIRLPEVAAELNRRGFRTRRGFEWSPVAVFELLPRLIDVGPGVFSSEDWATRRPRLLNVG